MPYNSAHHCVVEVENFLLLLGGEDQWNPNGTSSHTPPLYGVKHEGKERKADLSVGIYEAQCYDEILDRALVPPKNAHMHIYINPDD